MKNQQTTPYILLIEDDRWLAESYQAVLSESMPVVILPSLQASIEAIDSRQPSLIVADVMLDDGLVVDLLHELQSYSDTSDIPIIICSSLSSRLLLEDLRPYGVVKLLDKASVTPGSLRQAVGEYL